MRCSVRALVRLIRPWLDMPGSRSGPLGVALIGAAAVTAFAGWPT
jgi:hypothetical protein